MYQANGPPGNYRPDGAFQNGYPPNGKILVFFNVLKKVFDLKFNNQGNHYGYPPNGGAAGYEYSGYQPQVSRIFKCLLFYYKSNYKF